MARWRALEQGTWVPCDTGTHYKVASGRGIEPRCAVCNDRVGELHIRCLADLRKVLFEDYKFKCTQPEFLYDGLTAVVLPEVLRHKAGVPVSLGLVMLCVARRLRLPLRGCGVFLTASSSAAGAPPSPTTSEYLRAWP